MYNRLAIVPARAGSKRLPGKNLKKLNGLPLFEHTLKLASEVFTQVVFSSDSEEMLKRSESYENVIPSKREQKLASDTSRVIETVREIHEQYSKTEKKFDEIWLLLPTCPLRTKNDLLEAINLLGKEVDSVVGVTDFDFPPTLALSENNGYLEDWDKVNRPFANDNTRSQDHQKLYRPNGAIYGSWWDSFEASKSFFKGVVRKYYMPRARSIDIDTELDFKIAELVMKNG
jgi:CMP-N,N'-diacetyllegionaminic acid synthase